MKGSLRTVRGCELSSKTNFDDWSDLKPKLLPKSESKYLAGISSNLTQPDGSNKSLKSTVSLCSQDISEITSKIRQGQPLLTSKEIRNIRLPFHESLLLNLKEDGFLLTSDFIKDLILIDDIYHKDLETDLNLKNRPILKFSKSVLIPLSKFLIKAESAKIKGEKNQEATAFLDLAVLFGNSEDKSWNWVAQEMFEQCLEIVDGDCTDLRLRATAKYLYSLFLFNEVENLIEAKTQVECAISISDSKYWTVKNHKEEKEDNKEDRKGNTLYFESCILLHKILLGMSQNEMSGQNTDEAIKLCRSSLQLAKMIDSKSAEANALKSLIDIYMSVQQVYSVPELLQSYTKLCTDMGDFEGLCEGYIKYARYHDCIGEKANVITDMKKLLRTAEDCKIKNMVAAAHHKLATYCLLEGANEDLIEHSIEAYMCYMDLQKNKKELEETRCLVGIAQAQAVLSEYTRLVAEADSKNLNELSILIRWKNLRIPFFDSKMVFIPELLSSRELLDKVENARVDEFLTNASNRKLIQSNLSSAMSYQYSKSSFTSRGNKSNLLLQNPSFYSLDVYKLGPQSPSFVSTTKDSEAGSVPSAIQANKTSQLSQPPVQDEDNKAKTVYFSEKSSSVPYVVEEK